MHVVVVEDQQRMAELVTDYLRESGMRTTACHDGEAGLETIRRLRPDAVVLDLMLPGMSGTEVCRRLRQDGDRVPVLMLTARGEVRERVSGLESGADDYLVKPFALEELVARLRALARRLEPSEVLLAGDVQVDLDTRRVRIAGCTVDLPRREFAVLSTLMDPPGRVVSRSRLYDAVYDDEPDLRSNALEVHVSRVRQQLTASAEVAITTLRGVGYRLDVRR